MSEQLVEQTGEQQQAAGKLPTTTAAEQLRSAREKLGLSRDEVAAELRLRARLITALEENDRSQLPPVAFIGGYLRAYAKLLGLPADQLIAEYLNEGVATSSYRSTDRSGAQVVSSQDPKFRMISFGVVGGLLLLFALWWANDRYAFVGAFEPAVQEEIAVNEEEAVALPMAIPELRDPPQEEAATAAMAQSATATAATGGVDAGSQPLPGAVVANPAVPATSDTMISEPLKVPPPAVAVTSEPLPATTPQSTLRLEYQAASWTQVEDAQGRVLVYELVNPGRRIELRGVAPFKIFLGYAPGVLLYYNGSLHSHAAYQRNDLAKFTVGAAQDNKPLGR